MCRLFFFEVSFYFVLVYIFIYSLVFKNINFIFIVMFGFFRDLIILGCKGKGFIGVFICFIWKLLCLMICSKLFIFRVCLRI